MSLACLECGRVGAFNTLVIFNSEAKFESDSYVSSYPNFYTCCVSLVEFPEVKESRFAIVQEREHQNTWATGTDGERLGNTKYRCVDEAELRRKLPKIFEALAQKAKSD